MSTRITYASLQHNTWVYRRTYPRHLQPLLGSSLKQSLKTTDARVAKARVEELNATFAKVVSEAEASLKNEDKSEGLHPQTSALSKAQTSEPTTTPDTVQLNVTRPRYARVLLRGDKTIADLAKSYLEEQSERLRPGSYKSVRFAMELLTSHLGTTSLNALTQAQGREVLTLIGRLSPNIRKYRVAWGQPLQKLAALSEELEGHALTAKTQGRIWEQMTGFLTWAVQQGELSANPWDTITVTSKSETQPHAVLTDEQVALLLTSVSRQSQFYGALLFGLLAGLRSGELCGLTLSDIHRKGNLGRFVRIRPNKHRPLKSKAAEREVPLHPVLETYLDGRGITALPSTTTTPEVRLFPRLSVDKVVKAYAKLRTHHPTLQGTVFHSTRKWFVTQCERTGTPEHFTATLVGHASARSANRLTYGLYSGGISDEQKRRIVDGVRLPEAKVAGS